MKFTTQLIAGGFIIGIIAILVWYANRSPVVVETPSENGTSTIASEDEVIIRAAVGEFGAKLKNVSLAGPNNIIAQSIKNNYTAFVTPELLREWMNDPRKAPGRLTSSPWPDRIEITSISKHRNGSYRVEGNVIEITSKELAEGGMSGSYPIRLTIIPKSGLWYISEFETLN
jgi:hypothetical protein